MVEKIKLIEVGETGKRVGEAHQFAKLTDAQVDLILMFYEDGFVGYRTLAKYFNTPRSTISDICRYRRRSKTVMGIIQVRVRD